MKKIAIITSKGGTGKTTTAINLAHGLAMNGKNVLLVDCDSQANISLAFNVYPTRTLCDLLLSGQTDIVKIRNNLFFIGSGGRRLAEVELMIATRNRRENRLLEVLSGLKGCDYVICDCAPTINLITINVIRLVDAALIPISMDHFAPAGARQTLDIIQEVRELTGHRVELLGFLPTFFDVRTRISHQALAKLRHEFRGMVFNSIIRTNTQLREAPGIHKTIFEYAPFSYGAEDYFRLTEEIFHRERAVSQRENVV